MKTHDAINAAFAASDLIMTKYLDDFSDADLMTRPGDGCNHVAWQLGHLISSECNLINMIVPDSALPLPDGFAEKHTKDNADSNDAAQFCSKQQYLDLYAKVRSHSVATLGKLSDAELDREAPEHFRSMFPTMGSVAILVATHPMMHVGQFVPVRRALGKPVVI